MATDNASSIELLERCLPFIEDRYISCSHDEPWCVLTMYAAASLLKVHLGKESHHDAKTSCARRFLGLHYRYKSRQESSATANHQYLAHIVPVSHADVRGPPPIDLLSV